MVTSNRVVDSARVLVECLVVIEREHLSLLVVRILLLLLLIYLLKWRCLLLAFAALTVLLLLLILLIKEGEVVRIFAFALA